MGQIEKSGSIKSFLKIQSIVELYQKSFNVIFNQKPHQTDVFNRQKNQTNKKFNGPAIIEESTATTIIPYLITIL